MESFKSFPLIKQEALPMEDLTATPGKITPQFPQNLQALAFLQSQLSQQNLNPAFSATTNQRVFNQILMNGPVVDGKVPVDPKFLQGMITQNEIMRNQINSLLVQREQLFQSLNAYEQKTMGKHGKKMTLGLEKTDSEKKKRFRRTAKNISRIFQCPEANCSKSYGSEGSLHQHIRLKHPEFDITTWIQSRLAAEQEQGKESNQLGELSKMSSLSESISHSSSLNMNQAEKSA